MNDPNKIYVSPHFTFAEVVHSDTAIRLRVDNTPGAEELITAVRTAQEMEAVRKVLGTPISVNSWYRCEVLNASLGSKSTSQHRVGEAVDFISPSFGIPFQICKKLSEAGVSYDQLILEHTWVHISFAIRTGVPRNQVLSLLANGSYATGLTDRLGNQLK